PSISSEGWIKITRKPLKAQKRGYYGKIVKLSLTGWHKYQIEFFNILLGRLARDIKAKGTGLGEHLLLDALFRSYTLSEQSIGAMAVVVDPINENAVKFYKKYGFEQLPDSEKMFLPMNVIKQLI
ncbi:MAG: hypothetical protein AAF632_29620, partial [Bacteroidota bacterium]